MAKPYVLLVNHTPENTVLVWDALRGMEVEFTNAFDSADALVYLASALSADDPPQAAVVLLTEPTPAVALSQLKGFRKDPITHGVPVIVCNILRNCRHDVHDALCRQADACVQTRDIDRFVVQLNDAVRRLLFPHAYETLDTRPQAKP